MAEREGYRFAKDAPWPEFVDLETNCTAKDMKSHGPAFGTWYAGKDNVRKRGFFGKQRKFGKSRGIQLDGWIMGVVNRVLDGLGKGDSLLVVLVPSERKS